MPLFTTIGISRAALAQLAGELGLPALMYYAEVDSTQDILRHAAAAGAPEWLVVLADHQRQGRGQERRQWWSRPGAGLQFSVLLHPASDMAMALLPIRIGLALAAAIDDVRKRSAPDIRERIMLKWPNDLMLDDRKAGGVLIEAITRGDERWAVAGIGVNVVPVDVEPSAIDAGRPYPGFVAAGTVDESTRLEFFRAMIEALRGYDRLNEPALDSHELERYAARNWLDGRQLIEPVKGQPLGLLPDGRLQVAGDDATVAISSGRIVVDATVSR